MVDDTARTDEAIEDELGIQLEQAIKECNDELGLIPRMAEWQPWDVPADYTVSRHSLPTCWRECFWHVEVLCDLCTLFCATSLMNPCIWVSARGTVGPDMAVE